MQTVEAPPAEEWKRTGRRFGFVVAIAINVALLIIVQNLTSWDWVPFLTSDFDSLVPWISASLIVSIAANVVYIANDDYRVRAVGDIVTNLVSLVVTWRFLQVFPFDFSAYSFNWELVARVVLILAIIGTFAGAVAAFVRLANGNRRTRRGESNVGAV